MDIRLQKTKTVFIRGRVTAPAGVGTRNAMIALQTKGDMPMNFMARNMSGPYNDKGEFVINHVTPGSYTLTASVNEDGKSISARAQVEVGSSSIEGIALQLTIGSEISGRVKFEGSQTDAKTSNMRVFLQPKNQIMYGPGAHGGLVKEDNSFSFTNVQQDLYDIRVFNMPDGGYVKSIQVGDADVTDSPVDFTNGVGGEISLVVALAAGQITGTVQNDKLEPASGASVVLIPEGKRRENDRYYQLTATDQYGNYALKNVVPGEYRVFAFDTVEFGAYQDPEWLKPFESRGERLSVKDNDKQSVQLKLVMTQTQEQ